MGRRGGAYMAQALRLGNTRTAAVVAGFQGRLVSACAGCKGATGPLFPDQRNVAMRQEDQQDPATARIVSPPASLPPVPMDRDSILALLAAMDIETDTVDHAAVFTVAESAALRGEIQGAHTKNLFVRDKKGRFFLLTAREDAEIDLKGLHRLLGGQGRVSFGKADALMAHLGVEPGSVSALCIANDREGAVTFALDAGLMEADTICCHPLTNTATTRIARDDLVSFARAMGHEPLIVDLAAEDEARG